MGGSGLFLASCKAIIETFYQGPRQGGSTPALTMHRYVDLTDYSAAGYKKNILADWESLTKFVKTL
jgi:hypothetical protein